MRSVFTPRITRSRRARIQWRWTPHNIANFQRQIERAGLMIDWRSRVDTSQQGLLSLDAVGVPAIVQSGACLQKSGGRQLVSERQNCARQRAGRKTVCANGAARPLNSVFSSSGSLSISAFCDRLLRNLDWFDWSATTKQAQRNWIGRSEGAELTFKIQEFRTKKFAYSPHAPTRSMAQRISCWRRNTRSLQSDSDA